jgi:peptide deformylase
MLKRVQITTSALKLSAAASGSYSLSANQIGIANAVFVIHKQLTDGLWLHPEAYKLQEENPVYEDRVGVNTLNLFDPEDYEVYMNPRVHAESSENKYDWEYCLSFPSIRCMVKRPVACEVSYINGVGDLVEQELRDFKARVFLHELDHINGTTMTHWRVSEGNIDVLPEKRPDYENLMTTVEYYKSKIDELKADFANHPIFNDGK